MKKPKRNKYLLIGYGNPGRKDDGLGPALADAIARLRLPNVTIESCYQLTVEDAVLVAGHETVIFADAATCGAEPFFFRPVDPFETHAFTTHDLEPGAVLALARSLYGAKTRGYMLGIRGHVFNLFEDSLSFAARENLDAAARFLAKTIKAGPEATA